MGLWAVLRTPRAVAGGCCNEGSRPALNKTYGLVVRSSPPGHIIVKLHFRKHSLYVDMTSYNDVKLFPTLMTLR